MLLYMQDLLIAWGEGIEESLDGRSHRWLARQVGVHPTTIDRIVAGKINPTDELKWKIAGALHERMDRLFAWPKIVPPEPVSAA